jgi:hypothetical protein
VCEFLYLILECKCPIESDELERFKYDIHIKFNENNALYFKKLPGKGGGAAHGRT